MTIMILWSAKVIRFFRFILTRDLFLTSNKSRSRLQILGQNFWKKINSASKLFFSKTYSRRIFRIICQESLEWLGVECLRLSLASNTFLYQKRIKTFIVRQMFRADESTPFIHKIYGDWTIFRPLMKPIICLAYSAIRFGNSPKCWVPNFLPKQQFSEQIYPA